MTLKLKRMIDKNEVLVLQNIFLLQILNLPNIEFCNRMWYARLDRKYS